MFSLIFTGDVHFGDSYGDHGVFDSEILKTCRQSRHVVVNVEGPITSSAPRPVSGFLLHSHPRCTPMLEALGHCVFDLANNHILDHDTTGLCDTMCIAAERGWTSFGAGENLAQALKPCVITDSTMTVGVLGVCGPGVPFAGVASAGVFGDKPEALIRRRIRALKEQARWVVVVYHGGEEFTHIPLPARRRKLLRYLSHGADVVVAHHAHCVQRYERVGGKFVFYGLGNLIFDLDRHRHVEGTDESVLLSLSFGEQMIDFSPHFTRHDRDARRVLSVPSNTNFYEITRRTYVQEWGAEACRRLASYWNSGHEMLVRDNLRQQCVYCWKKLRRVASLLSVCVGDKYGLIRPYIVGGVLHHLRRWFVA